MIGYDGTGWGRPMEINPTGFGLSGVSCPSVSFCMAVDGDGSATTFDGAVVSPNVWGFGSVSCVSSSSCVATDSAGNAVQFDGSAGRHPSALTRAVSAWSPFPAPGR